MGTAQLSEEAIRRTHRLLMEHAEWLDRGLTQFRLRAFSGRLRIPPEIFFRESEEWVDAKHDVEEEARFYGDLLEEIRRSKRKRLPIATLWKGAHRNGVKGAGMAIDDQRKSGSKKAKKKKAGKGGSGKGEGRQPPVVAEEG